MQLVANALLAPRPAASTSLSAPPVDPARAAAAARPAPANLGGEWRPARIRVAAADLARARRLVERHTTAATASTAGDSGYLTIPNPDGLAFDEHPFLRDLVGDLRAAGIPLRSVAG
jgi:hypothetical protein